MIKGIIFDVEGVLVDERGDIVEENINLVKELKEGHQLGIISNRSSIDIQNKEMYDLFDSVIISGDTGFYKPQEEIYKIMLGEMNLNPDQVIFVDDLDENVEGANRVGINGILYTNPLELREAIAKLGVRVNL